MSRNPSELDAVIMGAGPYGLSLASHLAGGGLSIRVLGDPMVYWRERMPKGMLLRSSWDASHLADPTRSKTLNAYELELGRPISRPIPLDDFVQYGTWFSEKVAPEADGTLATSVEPVGQSFAITLTNGQRIGARHVFVATGLEGFARKPAPFNALPAERVAHASEVSDFRPYAGRRLAVIGGGQSALESAALAHEEGADVHVFSRRAAIRWLHRSGKLHQTNGVLRQALYPPTDVGPPVLNQIVSRPGLWKTFPRGMGERIAYRCIRPAGAGWLIDRLARVPISTGRHVVRVTNEGNAVSLTFDDGSRQFVDYVLLGTGYRIDVTRLPFLHAEIVRRLDVVQGYPVLRAGFESSVSGLHFVGAASAMSFGPVMRFVSGTTFTSREVNRSMVARASYSLARAA